MVISHWWNKTVYGMFFLTPILCDHVIRAKVEQAGDAARVKEEDQ